MKILVTGANGYLGKGIVRELKKMGSQIVAVDFCLDGIPEDIEKVECNIFEIDDPYNELGKPDCLLHLAWRDGFVHYSDNHILDLPDHYKFIKKMCESGLKKTSIMGSMHEIGFHEGSINEDTPCNPLSFYGIAKNALRETARIIAKNNNVIFQWLRGFYIVGNTENGSSVFSKIIKASREGKESFPFTQGLNQFDFLDYDLFCRYVALTVGQNRYNGIINICSGQPERLSDRVERFIKDNDLSIKLEYGAFPDRPYDSKAVWGDNSIITNIIDNQK